MKNSLNLAPSDSLLRIDRLLVITRVSYLKVIPLKRKLFIHKKVIVTPKKVKRTTLFWGLFTFISAPIWYLKKMNAGPSKDDRLLG